MDFLEIKINEMDKRILALEREVAALKEKLKPPASIPVQKRRRLDSMSLDLASDSNL